MYHVYLVTHYIVCGVAERDRDRELDSLLSATPFNIIYFHSIIAAILFVFPC